LSIGTIKTIIAAIIAAIISAAVFYNVGHYFGDGAGYKRHKTEMEAIQAQKAKVAQKKTVQNQRNLNAVNGEIDNAPSDVKCGTLTDAFIKRVR